MVTPCIGVPWAASVTLPVTDICPRRLPENKNKKIKIQLKNRMGSIFILISFELAQ
jgi:hypothetical protein